MAKQTLAFRLPRLTAAVDCAPIGYPGLKVRFWLNITVDQDRVTDEEWAEREAERKKAAEEAGRKHQPRTRPAWESDYYYGLSRMVEEVTIPGDYVDGDEDVAVPVPDGKALYDLMQTPGFEQQIVVWASAQYYALRHDRLQAEVKN